MSNTDEAIDNVLEQSFELAFPKTNIYSHIPETDIIFFYKIAVRICFLVLIINLFSITYLVFRYPTKIFRKLTTANVLVVVVTFVVLAIGENDEEARFLISILPIMAATSWILYPPTIEPVQADDIQANTNRD